MTTYPLEKLGKDEDNGTMPQNVEELASHVVGHRIVSAVRDASVPANAWSERTTEFGFTITLDNGKRVRLAPSSDCCAYTELHNFLLHPDKVDHIITGVGTEDGYTTWHIYADMGDVLDLDVAWSCGNPFYYGYGFYITVVE